MGEGYVIRAASAVDQAFITEMQYEAFFVPPGGAPFPRTIVDQPHNLKYHADFATHPGDVGMIAQTPDQMLLGAAWVRLVEGYGFVDADTPELGIAVSELSRGRGVGTAMLDALFEQVPRCSLSVDIRNPAIHLYERCGFELLRVIDEFSAIMLRNGAPA